MSQPIDVGSVLGGRYKVTATLLTSHDQDLVLDGVDQVLNRPVSILVAGPSNGEQVAASAREVATGQRPGGVQVLDLGVSEETTYLITNHTSAAELLDLLVAPNPPYVEPFFTDTLGSEIFGQPRSKEPEEDHDAEPAGYIRYSDSHPSQVSPYPAAGAASVPPRPETRPASAVPSPASTDAKESAASTPGTPAYGVAASGVAGAAAASSSSSSSGREEPAPKVSLWSENDYSQDDADQDYADEPEQDERRPAAFPAFARSAGAGGGVASAGSSAAEYDDDDADNGKEPRSMRWLVGGLLAVVLVAGLVFALTQLGSLFPSTPQANQPTPSSAAPETPTGQSSPTDAAPAPVSPVIESITRQGNFDFASAYDVDLVKAYDGNPASFWSNMEFATENWGGLVSGGVPLVIKLQEPSTVSSITLTQLGASGGRINVLTNDRPSLEGAKQVGTNSFTSTDLTMPLAEPVTAQYVIVQIDTLPRLAVPKTIYNYGLRLAEVEVQ